MLFWYVVVCHLCLCVCVFVHYGLFEWLCVCCFASLCCDMCYVSGFCLFYFCVFLYVAMCVSMYVCSFVCLIFLFCISECLLLECCYLCCVVGVLSCGFELLLFVCFFQFHC